MYHFGNLPLNIAEFSNQARRRLLKQALLRAKGLNVDELGYARAMQMARGKAGQPINSKSPFVRDLAKATYLSDPGDLAYAHSALTRTIREAPIDYGESGIALLKTGQGIAPTRSLAKQQWDKLPVLHQGTAPGVSFPRPATIKKPARGLINLHTHPLTDAATPSIQDLLSLTQFRVMRSLDNKAVLQPGASIDAYVAHQTRPGKYDLVKYGDKKELYRRASQRYLFKHDAAKRDEIYSNLVEKPAIGITRFLNRFIKKPFDPEKIRQNVNESKSRMEFIANVPFIRASNYNMRKLKQALKESPDFAYIASLYPDADRISGASEIWPYLRNVSDYLQQRKAISRLGRNLAKNIGYNVDYLGRYNV